MLSRLKRIKDYVQLGLVVVMSVANVWLSSESITQTIGVVYKFGNSFYNPALGIIDQDDVHPNRCTMKVASPFTAYNSTVNDFFHSIDPKYICKWSSDSAYFDSLCFDKFDCYPLELIRNVDIACSSLFLIGFILLGILFGFKPTNHRIRIFLWGLSTAILCFSFGFSKVSSSYLREMEVEDILKKIRSIVINQGSLDIEYDVTVSRYDSKTNISDVIFDVCSGMALGLIANSIKFLKRPKRKPRVGDTEMSEGFI